MFMQVVPKIDEYKCRAVIDAQEGVRYNIKIAAVLAKDSSLKMSNEMSTSLPLDTEEIVLPPPEMRRANADIYKEYLEVRDGSAELSTSGSGTEDSYSGKDSYYNVSAYYSIIEGTLAG